MLICGKHILTFVYPNFFQRSYGIVANIVGNNPGRARDLEVKHHGSWVFFRLPAYDSLALFSLQKCLDFNIVVFCCYLTINIQLLIN